MSAIAFVRKLSAYNFDPVNSESWLPRGGKTWERIEAEIESSHLFLLVLGENYGWIPTAGLGAEKRLSVTHMEYAKAREAGIPVIALLKKLGCEAPRDTEDAKKRDAFRREVSDWSQGQLVGEFELAHDLAEKVAASLIMVLTESFLQKEVRQRIATAAPLPTAPELEPVAASETISIPPILKDFIVDNKATLIAGSGFSLAGMDLAEST